ncbi:MAG: hypothetical protein ACK5RO_04765, partial [Pseudobdellovibrionaceae bacterium]
LFWDNHPFLYHLILKVWTYFFGFLEFPTRSLSALLSTGTIPLAGFLGLRLFGFRGLWIFASLQAINPISLQFAQETRMYAQLELISYFSFSLFCRYFLGDRIRIGSYLLSLLLLSWTHYVSLLVSFVQGFSLTLHRRSLWRGWVLSTGIALLSAFASYFYSFSWPHLEWQKLKFALEPDSRWPWDILKALSFHQTMILFGLGLGLIYLFRKRNHFPSSALIPHLIAMVLVQMTILTVIGFVTERSLFLERYYTYLTPYFVLFLGSLLLLLSQAIKHQLVRISFLIFCLCLLASASVPKVYALAKSPWREVAHFIAQSPHPKVLTTRTLSIRSPYYDLKNVPVEKLNTQSPAAIEQILSALETYDRVWIVEIYFGSLTYWDSLKIDIINTGLELEQRSFELPGAETIYTLEIKKAKPSE